MLKKKKKRGTIFHVLNHKNSQHKSKIQTAVTKIQ